MEFKDWKRYEENKKYLFEKQYKKKTSQDKQAAKTAKKSSGRIGRIVYYVTLSVCIMQATELYSVAVYKPEPARTVSLANEFSPKLFTNVEIVEPNGTDYELADEKIKNNNGEKIAFFENPTANTKAEYIRAKVVVMIKGADGNVIGSDSTLQYSFGSALEDWGWIEGQDGYYYYKYDIKPGERTSNLLENLVVTSPTSQQLAEENKYIEFNVLADSIHVTGESGIDAAIAAWGVNPKTGQRVS